MKSPQDTYVEGVVARRLPATIGAGSLNGLVATIKGWANQYLLEIKPSGSYAKGTAVAGSADIDLLISLSNDVLSGRTPTLSDLYHSLKNWLSHAGYTTRLQNISIRVALPGINVDLVPAVKRPGNTNDHSVFKRKVNSWRQTNIDTHIDAVRNSGRTFDLKAIKIWRNLYGLDISSFYLELIVLEALTGRTLYNPAQNFLHVLDFLGTQFANRNILDPANTANLISDELTASEKQAIARQAVNSRNQPGTNNLVMKKINLKEMMLGLQAQMDAKLSLSRRTLTHPGTIGDFSELEWLTLLSAYLPKRYEADKGFVVDASGSVSDQIDIIIFDRHYTPFVFHQNGAKYIPAEAVYAVIECKQDVTLQNIKYAAKKAKSVRSLRRTSSPIVHAGGTHEPKKLHNILAGLVCVGGAMSARSKKHISKLEPLETLNYICSLGGVFTHMKDFDLWEENSPPHSYTYKESKLSLVAFVMTLIGDLQRVGTVPAIDIKEYLSRI